MFFLIGPFLDPNFKMYWIDALDTQKYGEIKKTNQKKYIIDKTKTASLEYGTKKQETQMSVTRQSRKDVPSYVKTQTSRSKSTKSQRSKSNNPLTREKALAHASNANETKNLVSNKTDQSKKLFDYTKQREQQQSNSYSHLLVEKVGKFNLEYLNTMFVIPRYLPSDLLC